MHLQKRIRELLRSDTYHADGLTTQSLAILANAHTRSVIESLKRMPDAYIDRWQPARGDGGVGRLAAVWKVVIPPPNARPPIKKRLPTRMKN